VCRSASNAGFFSTIVPAALATLPAADQQEVYAAELEMNSWRSYVHSFPSDTSGVWRTLGALVGELRLAFYTAGFSQIAHTTMMEHLNGSRPLEDWSPVVQVIM
jgi:hypothetical protein